MAYQSQLSQLISSKSSFMSQEEQNDNNKINSLNIPIYEMTLEFTNNLFQTFLLEMEEKNGIQIKTLTTRVTENYGYNKNTVKITYNNKIYYLIFQNKNDFIDNVQKSSILFEYIYELTKLTEAINIILIFYMVNFDDMKESNNLKSSFVYFLNTKLNIKIVDLSNSEELVDYIYNFNNSILTKENKSKITFFDTKPVQLTSLTENEGINNLVFVKHLMCLPGLSEKIAIAIVKEYPRLEMLYDIYLSDEYDEEDKKSLLENIQIVGNNGKSKRIGPAISHKIYKFFTSIEPDSRINN